MVKEPPAPKTEAPKRQAGLSECEVIERYTKKRRQENRRDCDEQVERYVQRKLGHISSAKLDTARNEKGQSVRQFILEELKKKRIEQGRLACFFTVALYKALE